MDTRLLPLLPALVVVSIALTTGAWLVLRLRRRLALAESERRRTADELSRRLSELFSLQELSYVLSDSLQLERIAGQVVRYAMRFLDARGALLALVPEGAGGSLRVTAADGSLAALRAREVAAGEDGLIGRSVLSERLELVRSGPEPVRLTADAHATAAAAVPLRAHGSTVGTLVVADPPDGVFQPEDIRLLSTVATHAAIVLSNARFFALVERAKEQWQTAFDALREGIAVVDQEGRVQRANRSLAALLAAPPQSLLGQHLCHALLGRSLALMDLLDAARRGERPAPLVARSDALRRTLRINAARIPAGSAEHSVVVLVEDVTDQQAIEAQLIQSEKLAAVGQLISGVAHELNNPLTSIVGLSEFLLEQKTLRSADLGHLAVIHEQAERAGRIVRNLLTFARKGPMERERVDLNDVVQRTLLLMDYDLKLKGITVRQDLAKDLPPVLGERHALQQAVLNLVNNAAQAVSDLPAGLPRRVRVMTTFDSQVRLAVSDTGPGIPDDVLPHIFTPFFTTKDPGRGTGLGLSITYSIVEAHGGQIAVDRPNAGGSVFRVSLPAAPTDAVATAGPAPAEELQPVPATGTGKRTILLVDDDPAVWRVVEVLFGREGHAVEVARDTRHALERLAARSYDLVIVDGRVTSGRRDRKEGTKLGARLLVEELVERYPVLRHRLIVATGDIRPATEQTLLRLGLRYVRKPFNLRDLRDEAARVWGAAVG